MSRVLIPVNIRPHLVPFLFKEFPGISATYMGKKVKAVKVSSRNTFGKLIRLLAEESDQPPRCDTNYTIFLSLTEIQRGASGKVYSFSDGRYSFLKMPAEGVKMINDELESKFRAATLFYLEGWVAKQGPQGLQQGINKLIDQYRLLEFGFDPSSMRRNYYRWKKEQSRLSFIMNQASNKVHNY